MPLRINDKDKDIARTYSLTQELPANISSTWTTVTPVAKIDEISTYQYATTVKSGSFASHEESVYINQTASTSVFRVVTSTISSYESTKTITDISYNSNDNAKYTSYNKTVTYTAFDKEETRIAETGVNNDNFVRWILDYGSTESMSYSNTTFPAASASTKYSNGSTLLTVSVNSDFNCVQMSRTGIQNRVRYYTNDSCNDVPVYTYVSDFPYSNGSITIDKDSDNFYITRDAYALVASVFSGLSFNPYGTHTSQANFLGKISAGLGQTTVDQPIAAPIPEMYKTSAACFGINNGEYPAFSVVYRQLCSSSMAASISSLVNDTYNAESTAFVSYAAQSVTGHASVQMTQVDYMYTNYIYGGGKSIWKDYLYRDPIMSHYSSVLSDREEYFYLHNTSSEGGYKHDDVLRNALPAEVSIWTGDKISSSITRVTGVSQSSSEDTTAYAGLTSMITTTATSALISMDVSSEIKNTANVTFLTSVDSSYGYEGKSETLSTSGYSGATSINSTKNTAFTLSNTVSATCNGIRVSFSGNSGYNTTYASSYTYTKGFSFTNSTTETATSSKTPGVVDFTPLVVCYTSKSSTLVTRTSSAYSEDSNADYIYSSRYCYSSIISYPAPTAKSTFYVTTISNNTSSNGSWTAQAYYDGNPELVLRSNGDIGNFIAYGNGVIISRNVHAGATSGYISSISFYITNYSAVQIKFPSTYMGPKALAKVDNYAYSTSGVIDTAAFGDYIVINSDKVPFFFGACTGISASSSAQSIGIITHGWLCSTTGYTTYPNVLSYSTSNTISTYTSSSKFDTYGLISTSQVGTTRQDNTTSSSTSTTNTFVSSTSSRSTTMSTTDMAVSTRTYILNFFGNVTTSLTSYMMSVAQAATFNSFTSTSSKAAETYPSESVSHSSKFTSINYTTSSLSSSTNTNGACTIPNLSSTSALTRWNSFTTTNVNKYDEHWTSTATIYATTSSSSSTKLTSTQTFTANGTYTLASNYTSITNIASYPFISSSSTLDIEWSFISNAVSNTQVTASSAWYEASLAETLESTTELTYYTETYPEQTSSTATFDTVTQSLTSSKFDSFTVESSTKFPTPIYVSDSVSSTNYYATTTTVGSTTSLTSTYNYDFRSESTVFWSTVTVTLSTSSTHNTLV